jgi:hypothetical protein
MIASTSETLIVRACSAASNRSSGTAWISAAITSWENNEQENKYEAKKRNPELTTSTRSGAFSKKDTDDNCAFSKKWGSVIRMYKEVGPR